MFCFIEAAKNGFEYRRDASGKTWSLVKKTQQPVLRVSPEAFGSPELLIVTQVFKLKPGLEQYDISQEVLSPFPVTYPAGGVASLDLETRSMLQTLYFVSHGIDVPAEHLKQGLARRTLDRWGKPFNWGKITSGLFTVFQGERPANARVATR
jgi:hypothetical protein